MLDPYDLAWPFIKFRFDLINFQQWIGYHGEKVSRSLIQPKIVNSSFICVLFIVNSPASICVVYLSISIIFRLVLSTLVHIEKSGPIRSMLLPDYVY